MIIIRGNNDIDYNDHHHQHIQHLDNANDLEHNLKKKKVKPNTINMDCKLKVVLNISDMI